MKSKRKVISIAAIALIAQANSVHALAQTNVPRARVNSVEVPKQILRSGININSRNISPNTTQLGEDLKIIQIISRMQELRASIVKIQSQQQ